MYNNIGFLSKDRLKLRLRYFFRCSYLTEKLNLVDYEIDVIISIPDYINDINDAAL